MKILPLIVLALAVSCGAPEEPATDSTIIIIDGATTGGSTSGDDPLVDDTDPDLAPTCEPTQVSLSLPPGVVAVSAWDAGDAIYAAWVEPRTGASEVAWGKYSPEDGRELTPPTRAGAAVLTDQTNWSGGAYRTSIAVQDDGTVMVAWNSKSTTYVDGFDQDHSQVLVSRWGADGGRTLASYVASDASYGGYVVDADNPTVRPRNGGFVVAWFDVRLNEPRVYGQQGWPWGIYQTSFDAAGEPFDWDTQVQQSPSIWTGGKTFDYSDSGYVFLTGREPHGPAWGGATQELLDDRMEALIGNSRSITVATNGDLMAWTSNAGGSMEYLTAMRRDGAPYLVDRSADYDHHVEGAEFLEGGEQLAWIATVTPYEQPPQATVRVADLTGDQQRRASMELPGGTRGRVIGGRALQSSSRVIVASTNDDLLAGVTAYELCPEPFELGERLVVVHSDDSLHVDHYDTTSVSLNVSDPGGVKDVHLMMSGGRPEGDWSITHQGVTADVFSGPAPEGMAGQEARGLWTFTVTGKGYSWGFQHWALQLVVSD